MAVVVLRIVPALLAGTLAFVPAHAATKPRVLRLLDDRGKAITEELDVCFQIGTRSNCSPWRGVPIEVPQEFVSVRVEGPDHGPVSAPRQGIEKEPNGDLSLAVPRKAFLQVTGSPEERLTVSLYPQDDP
ncbi:MAG TPA: hypothetical protein VLX28_07010, partial [Thermoanaerobaculia bacterium]|nr:hypothetical protein [Thermoanaerobaculia bacterium]